MTIKEFCGLNSYDKDINGNEMSHEEKYTKIVNAVSLEVCKKYIPATQEEIIKALKTDKNLNNIPIEKWDRASGYQVMGNKVNPQSYGFRNELLRIGINVYSLSDCVCTLKQAARIWANS